MWIDKMLNNFPFIYNILCTSIGCKLLDSLGTQLAHLLQSVDWVLGSISFQPPKETESLMPPALVTPASGTPNSTTDISWIGTAAFAWASHLAVLWKIPKILSTSIISQTWNLFLIVQIKSKNPRNIHPISLLHFLSISLCIHAATASTTIGKTHVPPLCTPGTGLFPSYVPISLGTRRHFGITV